jgi:hypothetical protein
MSAVRMKLAEDSPEPRRKLMSVLLSQISRGANIDPSPPQKDELDAEVVDVSGDWSSASVNGMHDVRRRSGMKLYLCGMKLETLLTYGTPWLTT